MPQIPSAQEARASGTPSRRRRLPSSVTSDLLPLLAGHSSRVSLLLHLTTLVLSRLPSLTRSGPSSTTSGARSRQGSTQVRMPLQASGTRSRHLLQDLLTSLLTGSGIEELLRLGTLRLTWWALVRTC